MSKPIKIWIRNYWLTEILAKGFDFNYSTKSRDGYTPVTITEGHDEDTPPPIPPEVYKPLNLNGVNSIAHEHSPELIKDRPRCRWRIQHKMSKHKMVTINEYESFHESITETWPGQTSTRYTNYEVIGPYIEPEKVR